MRTRRYELRILKQKSGNEDWKKVLLAIHDSSINYYVSAPMGNTFTTRLDVDGMLLHLEYLPNRGVTGKATRADARAGLLVCGEIYRLILRSSLKVGTSVTVRLDDYFCN